MASLVACCKLSCYRHDNTPLQYLSDVSFDMNDQFQKIMWLMTNRIISLLWFSLRVEVCMVELFVLVQEVSL